jgi:hypothetical protein
MARISSVEGSGCSTRGICGSAWNTLTTEDSVAYAEQNGLRFDLYVCGGANPTTLSGPLQDAITRRQITLRFIP